MQKPERPFERKEGLIQLKVSFDRMNPSPIISGNYFQFNLEILNGTDREIEFPEWGTIQPKYHVKRPNGEVVTFSRMRMREPEEDPVGNPHLVRVAPGESWSRFVSLIPAFIDIKIPGRYEIWVTLDWNGIQAEAAPITFEVLPARFGGMAITQSWYEEGGEGEVEVLLLQRGAASLEVVVAGYRPGKLLGRSRAKVFGPRIRGPLPDDTTAILAPYLSYDPTFIQSFRWILAQTPRGIHVGQSQGTETTLIIPEFPIVDLLSPLAIRRPALFFFGILRDGKNFFHLAFTRLDYPVDSDGLPIHEAIPKNLPFKSLFEIDDYIASSAALGPHTIGSPLVVGMALRSEDLSGAEFIMLRVGHDGKIKAKRLIEIPGVVPLKASAVNITIEGKLRAAFVARERKGGAVQLVEITGTYDLTTIDPPRIIPVGGPLDPEARIDLRYFGGRKVGRFLLICQPGKEAMVLDSEELLRPAREDVPYDRPVELISGWNALVMYSDHVEVIEGL